MKLVTLFSKQIRALFFGVLLINLYHCAPEKINFDSLSEKHPQIIQVEPVANSEIQPGDEIKLYFSERIDFDSIQSNSIALVHGYCDDTLQNQPKQMEDWLEDHIENYVDADFILEGEEKSLTIVLPYNLTEGVYSLIVSTQLKSVDNIPFNQTPGSGPSSFLIRFFYGNLSEQNLSSLINDNSDNEDTHQQSTYEYGPEPEYLKINEVLYDGLLSETDGESFIELFGTAQSDISGYRILLINGADGQSTDEIILPENSWISDQGLFVIADLKTHSETESNVSFFDLLEQFDPQNGPDSIHLYNRKDILIDLVGYGDLESTEALNGVPLCETQAAVDVLGGYSLSRIDGIDTDNNAEDFVELEIPTPGTL